MSVGKSQLTFFHGVSLGIIRDIWLSKKNQIEDGEGSRSGFILKLVILIWIGTRIFSPEAGLLLERCLPMIFWVNFDTLYQFTECKCPCICIFTPILHDTFISGFLWILLVFPYVRKLGSLQAFNTTVLKSLIFILDRVLCFFLHDFPELPGTSLCCTFKWLLPKRI